VHPVELAALDNKPRSATITTCGLVSGCVIRQPDFLAAMNADRDLAQAVHQGVVAKARAGTDRRIAFTGFDAPTRFARIIRELALAHGERDGNRAVIDWPLTQNELASLASVAEPTAQKALSQLRKASVISTGYFREASPRVEAARTVTLLYRAPSATLSVTPSGTSGSAAGSVTSSASAMSASGSLRSTYRMTSLGTRLELTDCVRYMLDQFAARYKDTFPEADVGELRDADPVGKGWQGLEAWCQANLWGGEASGRALRQHVAELMAIRDAQLCADGLLGQGAPVADKLIREALDLGDDQPVPDYFPKRRLRPKVALADVSADGDALRATFPLIKRVSYQVLVDPDVWRLDGLRDENEVVLLDFPGLTAGRSALRDEFLSRDELRDIHTITVIIDAHKPMGEVQYRFYQMMERRDRNGIGRRHEDLRESILVVGNRYDMVKPPAPPAGGALSIADLRKLSEQLDGLCVKASDLVERQDDKIRLASSIAAMHDSGDLGGYATAPGEEGEKVRAAVAEAGPGLSAWGELASRVSATDPDDPWSRALADYAADGGMAGVRRLLEQHARAHGLSNKLRAMERTEERMWAALRPFSRALRSRQPPLSAADEAQQRIGELLQDFQSRHRLVDDALGELSDPMKLRRADGRPLVATAIDKAVTRVMRWRTLQLILQRSEDGFIPKTEAVADSGFGFEDPDFGTGKLGGGALGNETTAAFLTVYQKEFERAAAEGRADLAACIRGWIGDCNLRLGDLAVRLDDPDLRDLLEQGLAVIAADFDNADLMAALDRLKDLSWLAAPVNKAMAAKLTAAELTGGYPLYVDRAMPWHAGVPEQDDREQQLTRHQFYVLRLQRQLASGLADALSQRRSSAGSSPRCCAALPAGRWHNCGARSSARCLRTSRSSCPSTRSPTSRGSRLSSQGRPRPSGPNSTPMRYSTRCASRLSRGSRSAGRRSSPTGSAPSCLTASTRRSSPLPSMSSRSARSSSTPRGACARSPAGSRSWNGIRSLSPWAMTRTPTTSRSG